MTIEQLVMAAQAGSGDGAAFAEVCRRFTGLVNKYANQPHLRGIREEAAAEGWLALAAAVRTYDQASGVCFAAYAERRVKYAIWNLFKRERRRWQRELPLTGGGTNEDDPDEAAGLLDILAAADHVELAAEGNFISTVIDQALAALPEKQRLIVINTLLDDRQLSEVAVALGVTPQAVYGLRQRGLACLKKQLEKIFFVLPV
ncbi:sigma-70 family RNA polymerase sigma factor [Sporomusa sp.]|uniref:sigma-70 family RNA polymerase sigma factor n=1 Tax=Sporomusa sp. TaxID=2078658 RepID=UPI002CA97110|nr:sigma-70 family RNA polymerase sigma factor [Sporomusa sp.]HWR09564.1 sigma-70 family RNA polymerase sigma factor [Sporomusa sp.]